MARLAEVRDVQTADVEAGPDQVTFSDELAYVRHKGSETVLMIPLKTVGEAGRPVPLVDFPGGEHPPGRMARATPADGIVQAPGAAAVLVANPEDKVIYFYKEGMAAPMGHFQNYGKVPRAALVVELSDPQSGAAKPGLEDVRVLTFLAPGIWQQRHWAKDLGEGLYEIRFTPPEEGLYYVLVEVASQGLALQKSPFLVLTAEKVKEAAAH